MTKQILPILLLAITALHAAAFPSGKPKGKAPNITPVQEAFQLKIESTAEKISIDGELNEPIWNSLEAATNFWRKFPTDGAQGKRQTQVRVTYDEKFLYLGIVAYDSGKAFIQSLKRDGGHDGNDAVAVVLDPQNQHTNGFFFVVNAFNAQSEDQLTAGNGMNFSWDNKWFSATKRHEDKWVAELAIPFKTLRYSSEQNTWGINFVRIDTKTNEYSCWTKVPVNFASYDLGYTGALVWRKPPPPPGSNMVIVPYATGQVQSVKDQGKNEYSTKANAGLDAKIGLNSSLNLDLTLNPDFSQIEVDRQVTNLTRFNIFLPERRTFFLENADLFSTFGIDPIRPFYSRSIGLDRKGQPIPILAGARITGNLSPSTRVGLMNMQTGSKGDYSSENFTAATINQRVLKRSVVKAYFLNRQAFLSEEEKRNDPLKAYGRNAGAEFNFTNVAGTINAWGAYHQSYKPTVSGQASYMDVGVDYSSRKFKMTIDAVKVGTNYYTDMGFVERILNYDAERDTAIRVGFSHLFHKMQFYVFPKKGKVNSYRLGTEQYIVFNPNGSLNENNHSVEMQAQFKNTSALFGNAQLNHVNLLFPISFTGAKPLPVGSYTYWRGFIGYESDFRKQIAYGVNISTGQFYNGHYTSYTAGVMWRQPPHFSLHLRAEYNKLNFPGEYGATDLLLISPRVDINFTTSIFWTTFLQYNTQGNNFNINSRLQWRFRPMSDLYLVYTDNYFTEPFMINKNRALVLKCNYWLNW